MNPFLFVLHALEWLRLHDFENTDSPLKGLYAAYQARLEAAYVQIPKGQSDAGQWKCQTYFPRDDFWQLLDGCSYQVTVAVVPVAGLSEMMSPDCYSDFLAILALRGPLQVCSDGGRVPFISLAEDCMAGSRLLVGLSTARDLYRSVHYRAVDEWSKSLNDDRFFNPARSHEVDDQVLSLYLDSFGVMWQLLSGVLNVPRSHFRPSKKRSFFEVACALQGEIGSRISPMRVRDLKVLEMLSQQMVLANVPREEAMKIMRSSYERSSILPVQV